MNSTRQRRPRLKTHQRSCRSSRKVVTSMTVSAGKKYYGKDLGNVVDVYAAAFPDMHRELYSLYFNEDVVVVELSLNGTHKGDLALPDGVIPPTNKEIHAPCCDVFHLKDERVTSFHCYVAVPILLGQLGVFGNLSAAVKR